MISKNKLAVLLTFILLVTSLSGFAYMEKPFETSASFEILEYFADGSIQVGQTELYKEISIQNLNESIEPMSIGGLQYSTVRTMIPPSPTYAESIYISNYVSNGHVFSGYIYATSVSRNSQGLVTQVYYSGTIFAYQY